MSRARRMQKPCLVGLVALAVAVVSAGLVIAYTAAGRRLVAARIAWLVTDQIPGRLAISEITELSWRSLRAKDIRFFHPDGRLVLRVDSALVEPNWLDLLRARLSFRRVVAQGGSLLLDADPDGRLSLEATMDAPYRPGMPRDPERGLHYDMRNMQVKNFELQLPMPGFEELRVTQVRGVVHVYRLDTVGTRVRLTDLAGTVVPEVAGAKLAIRDLDAMITGAEAVVAEGQARLAIDGDNRLSVKVRYAPKHEEKVQLDVLDKHGTKATTLTWLMHAAASFSPELNVDG